MHRWYTTKKFKGVIGLVFFLAILNLFLTPELTPRFVEVDPPDEGFVTFVPPQHLLPPVSAPQKLTKYINPFIGTKGKGNVWVGAAAPNGMVKVGIDSHWTQQGYSSTKPISGVSFLHLSGGGGGDSYQVISMHPLADSVQRKWDSRPDFPDQTRFVLNSSRANEAWKPGYFAVDLVEEGCRLEISATSRAAIHKYTLLKAPKDKLFNVIFDVGRTPGLGQGFVEGDIKISPDGTLVESRGKYQEWWANGLEMNGRAKYNVYLCASVTAKPSTWGYFSDVGLEPELNVSKSHINWGLLGGYLTYELTPDFNIGSSLEVRTGLSFVSTKQACDNMKNQLGDSSLEQIQKQTEKEWEALLNLIQVKNPRIPNYMQIFYSSLFRSFWMPTNHTGENPKFESSMPYYNDWYCIWDTYRTLHPLITLIDPARQVEMVNSMIDIQDSEGGYFFDSRIGGFNGLVQGGTNADVVIADAFVKKLPGINWTQAYEGLKHDADDESENYLFEGRGDLEFAKIHGYTPSRGAMGMYGRAASRTMEYAYDDYCISLVAEGLGKFKDAAVLKNRSTNWENLWNPEVSNNGHSGFVMSRDSAGAFVTGVWEDPTLCSPINFKGGICHFNGNEFYEDSSWSYSFYVPQNIPRLIEKVGGKEKFVDRLDTFFDKGLFMVGNEPSFLIPYLYNYADAHDKTVKRVREAMKVFTNERDGLPGNDDGGAMASWFVFNSIGFFPVAGQDLYLVGFPSFEEVTMTVGVSKKQLIIRAKNFVGGDQEVEKVELNGVNLKNFSFRHSAIVDGGELVFTLKMR